MALWISLLYFSSMEALQAVSYTSWTSANSPLNQTLTLLGFLHIAFQPFFHQCDGSVFHAHGRRPPDRALGIFRLFRRHDSNTDPALSLQLGGPLHPILGSAGLRRCSLHRQGRMAHRVAGASSRFCGARLPLAFCPISWRPSSCRS